jgi:tetratricopeptide (TPR) repeat protein
MNKLLLLICVFVIACESKKEYLIQVPEKTRITSEYILSELEERAKEEPENEWLLNQQFYFCEQLGWPDRCERPLLKAKEKFGLSERLIDRFVAFYLRQGNYSELALILQGTVETRSRLEALIQISMRQDSIDFNHLNRYLERNQDSRAFQLAIKTYLFIADTAQAIAQIKKLQSIEPKNALLTDLYPILMEKEEYTNALEIIDNQLAIDSLSQRLLIDQGIANFRLGKTDMAKLLLKRVKSDEAFITLHDWYKADDNYDSALFYLKKVGDYSANKRLQLSHAEILESKGFITLSLPYFETALVLDTADFELQNRVEIVRRKVAYLQYKREQQALPALPKVERKTLGN